MKALHAQVELLSLIDDRVESLLDLRIEVLITDVGVRVIDQVELHGTTHSDRREGATHVWSTGIDRGQLEHHALVVNRLIRRTLQLREPRIELAVGVLAVGEVLCRDCEVWRDQLLALVEHLLPSRVTAQHQVVVFRDLLVHPVWKLDRVVVRLTVEPDRITRFIFLKDRRRRCGILTAATLHITICRDVVLRILLVLARARIVDLAALVVVRRVLDVALLVCTDSILVREHAFVARTLTLSEREHRDDRGDQDAEHRDRALPVRLPILPFHFLFLHVM